LFLYINAASIPRPPVKDIVSEEWIYFVGVVIRLTSVGQDIDWLFTVHGRSKKMIKEHSAGAVLYGYFANDEQRFLLLHYTSGHWDFPKGNVEAGETEVEAVIREIFEETGITDLGFVEGFIQPIFYNYRREGKLVHKKVSYYLAQTLSRNINLSNEHQDFLWANYPSALTTLTYSSARDILILANQFVQGMQT